MTLFKLNAASSILIEDDCNRNIIPLLVHLVQDTKNTMLHVISYEQPAILWKKVFNGIPNQCTEKFQINNNSNSTNDKLIYFIDSINQMALDMGWHDCLKCIKKLQNDVSVKKIILVLHKDCLSLSSKLQIHLNHISNAIISFDEVDYNKIHIEIKKGGKLTKTDEILTYDSINRVLKLSPVPKLEKKAEEPEKILPSNLSTFKIETDQIQQLQKNKLVLPYMSKINEGQGKVYYEPDAVDDWDEEDPDDDLEI